MNISVFCSANDNISPEYFRKTEELGRWIGSERHTLVFGGCNVGLMECIGRSAHEAGARTIGVIPVNVEAGARRSEHVDVEIPCDSLSERKDLMLSHSDVAIALPGGIGTLDEIFSQASSATIGYHRKRVIVYDMDGFWDKLVSLLDYLQSQGMMRGDYHRHIEVARSFDELVELVRRSV